MDKRRCSCNNKGSGLKGSYLGNSINRILSGRAEKRKGVENICMNTNVAWYALQLLMNRTEIRVTLSTQAWENLLEESPNRIMFLKVHGIFIYINKRKDNIR